MSPIGRGTHWKGPLLGSDDAFGGVFQDVPADAISNLASKYKVYYEPFLNDVADITAMATLGWTETDVNTSAARAVSVSKENGFLLINAGTTADSGSGLQHNAAVSAAAVSGPHVTCGPLTSTTTLMDNRELIFAARIGYAQAAARWSAGTGSKFIAGWVVTDTAMMTPTTGALSVATGGGLFFHVTEAGALNFVAQRTGTAVSYPVVALIPDATSATVVGNWFEIGFRAVWNDASDNAANGYVEYYYNGRQIGRVANVLPMSSTETYSVSFEVLNGPAASPNIDLGVDYILTAVSRPGVTRLT